MIRPVHFRLSLSFIAWLALWLNIGHASDAGDEVQLALKLEQVRQEISALQTELQRTRGDRDQEVAELRAVEKEVGRISLAIQNSDREIGRLQAREQGLQSEQRQLEADLSGQQQALQAQLRTAYTMGSQPRLKLLLSQSDAGAFSRNLVYFSYYNQARLELIDQVDRQLARLSTVEVEILAARQEQERARARLRVQRQQKQKAADRRQRVVNALLQKLGQQQSRLTRLGQDQRHTQTLLTALRDIFADIPANLEAQPFGSLRGSLSWPTRGSLRLGPGQDKPDGMNRQGVLVDAAAGTEVQVISHGRVAYADWLRGFGLLTIVDHGDGYLSLYGFNESLLKGVGDWVIPGEVIASVGNSGGRDRPALYFELRKNGRPIDPGPWLKSENPGN